MRSRQSVNFWELGEYTRRLCVEGLRMLQEQQADEPATMRPGRIAFMFLMVYLSFRKCFILHRPIAYLS